MERIGKAARRLLQELDARVAIGKTSSERSTKGSDELEKPERSAKAARRPGSCASRGGNAGGLELKPEARTGMVDEVASGNRQTLLRGNVYRVEFGGGTVTNTVARGPAVILAFAGPRPQAAAWAW